MEYNILKGNIIYSVNVPSVDVASLKLLFIFFC